MSTSAKADIRLKLANEKQVKTLLDTLTPEANSPVTRRAHIKLQKKGLFFVLTVEAEDTVALRATLNTYLRWIESTVNVVRLIEDISNADLEAMKLRKLGCRSTLTYSAD